jgi:hypothetical protein
MHMRDDFVAAYLKTFMDIRGVMLQNGQTI